MESVDQRLPKFFRLAKKASALSNHRHKLGATIIQNGKPISSGCNDKFKFSSLTRRYNNLQSVHAEVSAIIQTRNKELLKGSTIIVYRQTPGGHTAMARPCDTCSKILSSFGVKKMIYTTSNGFNVEYL